MVPRDPKERARAEEFARRYYERIGMPDRVIGPKDVMMAAGILKYYPADVIRGAMDAVCRYYSRATVKARARHLGLLRAYCEHYDEWVEPHLRREKKKAAARDARLRGAPTAAPTPAAMTISDDCRERMKMRARRAEDTETLSAVGLGELLGAVLGRIGTGRES